MSTKALAWAVEQETGNATRKCVLLLIADLADEQFTCYPGRPYLAQRAEIAETTVSKIVTQLVDGGFLRVLRRAKRRGGRRSNRYLVLVHGPDTPLPDVEDWVGEFAPADDSAGEDNSAPEAPLTDEPDETAGESNGAPEAPLPGESNGAPEAHSTVLEEHVSLRNGSYPLPKTQDPPPPPTSHPVYEPLSAAETERLIARNVLRMVTSDVDVSRLPTAVERDRLVERTVELLGAGWTFPTLSARLVGMGPLHTVASVYAVLKTRLRDVGPPPAPAVAPAPAAAPLPWCRAVDCDPHSRRQIDDEGRPKVQVTEAGRVFLYCPDCSGR
jgi:hypothetical protein